MNTLSFTDIEDTISFWTRNDFAIANNLLVGNKDWETVLIAYDDNKGVLAEYENGIRKIESEYDVKWINSLRSRLIDSLDDQTKNKVLETAKKDIYHIINAMQPANRTLSLYRTAWLPKNESNDKTYPYAHQYPALCMKAGDILDIKIISSTSITPYREDETEKSFYRYEITVPANMNILELDQYECHNEDGEILLPPTRFRVKTIHHLTDQKCKGIIEMECVEQLPIHLSI